MGRKACSLAEMRPLQSFLDFSLSLEYPGIIKCYQSYTKNIMLQLQCQQWQTREGFSFEVKNHKMYVRWFWLG